MVDALPPLAPEDHTCASCRLSYADLDPDAAGALVAALPERLRAAVDAVPSWAWRGRPAPDVWSVAEYVCHVRDVHVAFTIRLHRARTEDRPVFDPMLNDLRVRRFRYDEHDVPSVLHELGLVTPGLLAEIDRAGRSGGWSRTVTRLPGEERTALWLARQCAHEGVHHTADVAAVGRQRTASLPEQPGPG